MRLPLVPKLALRSATGFRFRVVDLIVEVNFSEGAGKGWGWEVYKSAWVAHRKYSPKWHRTAESALRSAWAFLRREARKEPKP